MKRHFFTAASGIGILNLLAALVITTCSNNPMDPIASNMDPGQDLSLAKEAVSESYTNGDGNFQFNFLLPGTWRKTLHGKQNISGTTDRSDVVVYSPSEKYVPRFTIISFSHNPGYPKESAEFWSVWRENKIKEFYPDRYLGRVERGYASFAGRQVPMVVYDMLDESKQASYRSTEFTVIVGGKLCTIQFATPNASDGLLEKGAADDILAGVYNSFKIAEL